MTIWRSCTCVPLLLIFSAGAAPMALAADDSASAVLVDCGAADPPDSSVDSCLERARVLDETDPSPQLQSLEAQLEQRSTGQRSAHHEPRSLQTPAGPSTSAMVPDSGRPTVVESDHYLPPAAAEPDRGRPVATDEPVNRMPDEHADDQGQRSAAAGSERPPAGIEDDLPPVTDPPDDDAPSARAPDPGDNPQ